MDASLGLPYSFFKLVEKVCHYTNTPFEDGGYLYTLASMAEESKLKVRELVFQQTLELNQLKNSVDGNNWSLFMNKNYSSLIESNICTYNRCVDYLMAEIKKKLRPVWGVYWSESCTSPAIIVAWLTKADADQGSKLLEFMENKGK